MNASSMFPRLRWTGEFGASETGPGGGLRPRRPACGIIGPVAVETDDAPLDAVTGADHAAVLDDRIIDPMPLAVGNQDRGGAEPSWNRARGPRLPSDLPDFLEPHDCKGRIPESAFLGGKSRHDLVERSALDRKST